MITLASLLQSTATPAPDSAWLIAGFALFGAALVLFALERFGFCSDIALQLDLDCSLSHSLAPWLNLAIHTPIGH